MTFDSIRHEFLPIEQASSQIQKQLVSSIAFMLLLHQWACLAWQVGIVSYRVGCRVAIGDLSPPQHLLSL